MTRQQLTDEEKYHLNIYHKTNDTYCKKQLDGLYGLVNEDQDRTIQPAPPKTADELYAEKKKRDEQKKKKESAGTDFIREHIR